MAASTNTNVIEQCQIHPIPAPPNPFSLPIVFFDLLWYDGPPSQNVYLFDFPCSRSDFLESILPDFKKSLSLTLNHFLPVAGSLIHYLKPRGINKDVLRYAPGDSVTLTVAESNADLSQLIGNRCTAAAEFHKLVPLLPPAVHTESYISCPVFAFQITLFPGQGISLGFTDSHVVADASTLTNFMRAWAMVSRNKLTTLASTEAELVKAYCLPFYDRKSLVGHVDNRFDSIFWEKLVMPLSFPGEPLPVRLPNIGEQRSTLILKGEELQKLKENGKKPLSSFVATCALAWVCFVRSRGEEVDDEEAEWFSFLADCRGRITDASLPGNYFGNCVVPVFVEVKHKNLIGKDGYLKAVESLREAVRVNVYGEKGILHGAEEIPEQWQMSRKRHVMVAASSKFDIYEADFGWGRAKKFELLSIEGDTFSLCKSRDSEGGLEIGISKTRPEIEGFCTVFTQVLGDLLNVTQTSTSKL